MALGGNHLKVGKVFVAGGLPTHTYIPRGEYKLEQKVRDYLDEGHRILSIAGPTKTGKTVLVKSVLAAEQVVWLSGGTISSIEDFWQSIADDLGLITGLESSNTSTEAESRTTRGELNVGFGKGGREGQSSTSSATSDKSSRTRPVVSVAREALRTGLHIVVIDDFHYVPSEVQLQIVRGLKDLVFDGLPVIVISVPHRAYDVVRVEKEMTGRVEQLEVGFWSKSELLAIAQRGFEALNVVDAESIAERLADESFSSPHLMQSFCLQVCKYNDVRSYVNQSKQLFAPAWEEFFAARAQDASRTAFDVLARGPRQRTDRKIRTLKNGVTTDIYGVVLAGIANTGPRTAITYEQLRASIRDVISEELPQRHEVTRVLEEMSKIARDQIEGEPVVDFDEHLSTLHISDPYFAFFLKWRVDADVNSPREDVEALPLAEDYRGGINVGGNILAWRSRTN
ncbi:hypothetical protein AB0C33_20675 [Nonomuraea sp. NPDC048881]|uniref:hypothetical protein n=1 Tax=Nonomuraea sp. NPDC048881 TaxID=3155030 RepID=UPI0033E41ED1